MDYSTIKNTDIKITRIGFGCSNFGGIGSDLRLVGKGDSEDDAHKILDAVYDLGINYYDTATTYGNGKSEEILGNWIKKNTLSRKDVFISSKVSKKSEVFPWNRKGLSKKHILKQIEASLKRLQLDYLDIFYIHAPDPATPIVEILGALDECVRKGLSKAIGISNVTLEYLKESVETSKKKSWSEYAVVQNSYNYLKRNDDNDVIPFCKENGILYIGYEPLAGGILTGKYQKGREYPENTRLHLRESLYRKYLTQENFQKIDELNEIAVKRNVKLPVFMYEWLYKNENIDSFLIGPRNTEQFQSVRDALEMIMKENVLSR
jgi:aryl-alcohol dehydrogenase-like predicted oxidoreductase